MAGQESVWGWMWVYPSSRREDGLEVIPYFEAFPTQEQARAHLQRHLDGALPDAPAAKAAPMLRVIRPGAPVVVRCPPDAWIVFEVPAGTTVDSEAAAYVDRNRDALVRGLSSGSGASVLKRVRDNALVLVVAVALFGLAVLLGPFLLITSLVDSGASPSCDGRTMSPGDVCQIPPGRSDSGVFDYQQMLERAQSGNTTAVLLGLVVTAVEVVLVLVVARRRMRERAKVG
ncbi:hypothetical protein [Amycolatopsis sp. NPDC059021]|uniref:hypothetical protein n=1 Tax=Amycolatopsis sp. NPDC059021 TaxID=3346704 RepID=UPI00367332BD